MHHPRSPAAGGVFSKNSYRMKGEDRVSKMVQGRFDKPEVSSALEKIHEYADAAGITGHEVALRWVLHHSALRADLGDAIIIGASSMSQLDSSLKMCEGEPLPQNIVDLIDEISVSLQNIGKGYGPFEK